MPVGCHLTLFVDGTCWIGGYFHEHSLPAALKIESSQQIIALTPLGYSSTRTSFMSLAIRAAALAHRRKPIERIFFWQHWGKPLQPG